MQPSTNMYVWSIEKINDTNLLCTIIVHDQYEDELNKKSVYEYCYAKFFKYQL